MQKKTKIKLSMWDIRLMTNFLLAELQNTVDIKNAGLLSIIVEYWLTCVRKKQLSKGYCTISIPYTVALCFYAFYNGRKIDNEEVYLLINKILAEIDKTIDSQIRLKSFEISEVV